MLRNTSVTRIASTVRHAGTGVVCAFGFKGAAGAFDAAVTFSGNDKSNIDKIVTFDNPAYSLVSSERIR
jgi:hypothetical protein